MSGKRINKFVEPPSAEEIQKVHEAILPFIHVTPVLSSTSINELTGADIYFKCENFQKNGAFKIRGAMSAALSLDEEALKNGLTTHSSGNHAQGVAKSAQYLNVPAFIVMPENSVQAKIEATKKLGAKIIFCDPTIEAREKAVKKIIQEKNATYIHPYNDYNVIAGQGTIALELLEQQHHLDIIISPVSGGGLLSGISIVSQQAQHIFSHYPTHPKIIAAEPKGADDAYRSFYSKKLEKNISPKTICDGLRANLGIKTFPIILQHVNEIFTCHEESIIRAMRLIWERMKIIIEPSSAVPLAVILENRDFFSGKKIGVIVTGGNVDFKNLPF